MNCCFSFLYSGKNWLPALICNKMSSDPHLSRSKWQKLCAQYHINYNSLLCRYWTNPLNIHSAGWKSNWTLRVNSWSNLLWQLWRQQLWIRSVQHSGGISKRWTFFWWNQSVVDLLHGFPESAKFHWASAGEQQLWPHAAKHFGKLGKCILPFSDG